MKYISLLIQFIRLSILRELEYKANIFIDVFGAMFRIAVQIIFLEVIFLQIDSIAGWTKYEVIFTTGLSMVIRTLFIMTISDSVKNLGNQIVSGDFDFLLLRPLNVMFQVCTQRFELTKVSRMIIGFLIMLYSASKLSIMIDLYSFMMMLLALGHGFIVLWAIGMILVSLCFKFGQVAHIIFLWIDISEIGRIPLDGLNDFLKTLFTIILPCTLLGITPSAAIFGRFDSNTFLIQIFVTYIWLFLAIWIWKLAIKSYSSAGG